MWIETEKGVAVNLSHALKIYYTPFNGHNLIEAVFEDATITINDFKNTDDAKNYVAALVNELNGKKPSLGYAFSWMARVEQLPPDDRAKFDKQVNEWLAELQGSLQPTDTKGEFVLNPKKFNDDGIEW